MLAKILILILPMFWYSCGMFVDKPQGDSSSSRVLEFSSSSAKIEDNGRVEWDYNDTLKLQDTVGYKVKSAEGVQRYYLGKLRTGDRIRLSLRTENLDSTAEFRIKTELGKVQMPFEALGEDYMDYHSTLGSQWSENNFGILDSGYIFLELKGQRKADLDSATLDSLPDFSAVVYIDSAYFAFTGGEDSLELEHNSTLFGFFRLDRTEDLTTIGFKGDLGTNLTLSYQGHFMEYGRLIDAKNKTIDSAEHRFSHQLLPTTETDWQVKLKPVIPSYATGNYAHFSLHLSVTELLAGEYFENPDTLKIIGDTLRVERAGSEFSGWDVRHDHYVYLGDFAKNDTLLLYYGTEGINGATRSLRLLNAKAKEVQKLSRILGSIWTNFAPDTINIPEKGKYYLHYNSLGKESTHWTDGEFKLRFYALAQQYNSTNKWSVKPKTLELTVGDTLFLDSLKVSFEPEKVSGNKTALLAREYRDIMVDSLDVFAESHNFALTGDQISSPWLVAKEPGIAEIMVQSVADPLANDVCVVTVIP
ncbi:MAG: hypothetical protein GX801_00640 [Fibrobacter sp.]|nr:hypothetical protein [Fibrobacter sp.]